MNYEKLLAEYRIKKIEPKEFNLSLTERGLESARHSLDAVDYGWAFSIAYNAASQAGRALKFHLGHKPSGGDLYKAVFDFLKASGFDQDLTDYFDCMRRIRHAAVYDVVDAVSEEAASEAGKFYSKKIRTEEK